MVDLGRKREVGEYRREFGIALPGSQGLEGLRRGRGLGMGLRRNLKWIEVGEWDSMFKGGGLM